MTKKIDSQNCKNLTFKVIFLRQKLSKSLWKKNSLKNINLGQQLLLKSFFDKFNFKNNLLLKLGCKIAIFLNLTTLFKKLQKNFWCNFCDSTSISFIVISFHQIPLTWWNAYASARELRRIPKGLCDKFQPSPGETQRKRKPRSTFGLFKLLASYCGSEFVF